MPTVNDPKQSIRILRMIHISMMIGILAFLAISLHVTSGQWISVFNLQDPLFLALTIVSITMLPLGWMVSNKRLKKGQAYHTMQSRIEAYQTGLIIRLAVCEGVALFSIVTFLMTSNIFALIYLVISLGIMVVNFPGQRNVIQHLKPGSDEAR